MKTGVLKGTTNTFVLAKAEITFEYDKRLKMQTAIIRGADRFPFTRDSVILSYADLTALARVLRERGIE